MNTEEINDLYWWAQERVRGFMSGLHRSPDFGYSVEFAQHRQYVPGDSPKHIDWSVLAKTDRYLTKQFEAESNMRSYFLLDSSSSMQAPAGPDGKWNTMVKLIVLIAALIQKQRDALGLMEVHGESVNFFESSNKEERIHQLLNHIQGIGTDPKTNTAFSNAIQQLLVRIPKRSQVLIFTDLYHEDEAAFVQTVNKLRHAGHHVRVFMMFSTAIEMEGKSLSGSLVEDLELGTRSMLNASDVKRYTEFCVEKLRFFESAFRTANLQFDTIDIDDGPLVGLRKIIA